MSNTPPRPTDVIKPILDAWVPKFIEQVVALYKGGRLTAERFNELMNLLIEQGDDTIRLITLVREYLDSMIIEEEAARAELKDYLDQQVATMRLELQATTTALTNLVNSKSTELTNLVNTTNTNLTNLVNTTKNDLTEQVAVARQEVVDMGVRVDNYQSTVMAQVNSAIGDVQADIDRVLAALEAAGAIVEDASQIYKAIEGKEDKANLKAAAYRDVSNVAPAEGSTKLITSGAVKTALGNVDAVTLGGKTEAQLIKYDDLFAYTDGRIISSVLWINIDEFDDSMRKTYAIAPGTPDAPPGMGYGVRLPCIAYDKNGVLVTVVQLDPYENQGKVWTNVYRKHLGSWTGWRANNDGGNAYKLDGKTADNFAQYISNALYVKRQDGDREGGQISLESPITSTLTEAVHIDVLEDDIRIYGATSSGLRIIQTNIAGLLPSNYSLTVHKASTSDINQNVTNIGKNALYIVYE